MKVLDECGNFPADTGNLTVIGWNYDGECLVARLGSTSHATCKEDHLTFDSEGTCGSSYAIAKVDELNMVTTVCLGLHVVLMGLAIYEFCARGSRVLWAGVLFWWSDFWAGLFFNLVGACLLTKGIDDPVRSFVVGLVYGMALEEIFYDLPIKVVKCGCGHSLSWILAVSIVGFVYLLDGIYFAYSSQIVASVGHHAILHGIAQWIADIVKAVIKKHVLDYVCQRPQKETYQMVITELAEPLPEVPEVPRTVEGESQEDPGKV